MKQKEFNHFLDRIRNGSSFFCLRLPEASQIDVFILDPTPTPLERHIHTTGVCVCAFDSSVPKLYRSLENFSISAEAFDDLVDYPNLELTENDPTVNTTSEDYTMQVSEAKKIFDTGELHKVVLAQKQQIATDSTHPLTRFIKLTKSSSSYCYLLHLASQETWIGASPELFLKSDMNHFETMALAGTRPKGMTSKWGDKETKEQAIVGEFICNELIELGFLNVVKHKPFTKSTGPIEHICSPITATVPSNISWGNVVSHLHPTPALAGYPKMKAMRFISNTESFNRELFGGYMGIVSSQSIELFVNIRCAKLGKSKADIFAGAGLNSSSIPIKEWEETNSKLDVIKKVLR